MSCGATSHSPISGSPARTATLGAMIRLRQIALVAADLDPVVNALCDQLRLQVCFRDPGVSEFGLVNALMVVGDQFIEVVAPNTEGTTAGRLLDRRGGDGGYMVLFEVDDLDARMDMVTAAGVRTVWSGNLPTIRGRHLHPRDVGGAIVSIDEPVPAGSWTWGGPTWAAHQDTSVVSGIAGVTIGATDPEAMCARWDGLGLNHSVEFVAAGSRGEGVDGIDLVATNRSDAGSTLSIGGVQIRLV